MLLKSDVPTAPASTAPDLTQVARQARASSRRWYRAAAAWDQHATIWDSVDSAHAAEVRGWADS